MTTWILELPVIGRCDVVPQEPGSVPGRDKAVVLVELEGNPDRVVMGFWNNGQFRNHNNKAFSRPVSRWFEIIDANGRELL